MESVTCPRCKGYIPHREIHEYTHRGALSRVDNKTEICSDCGVEEAILQYRGQLEDWINQ